MSEGDKKMWTARLRGTAVGALPSERLLPDKQRAYVSSWIHVFGVLTLKAPSLTPIEFEAIYEVAYSA